MSHGHATVFLVDDDRDVREALTRLLRSARYQTRSFGSSSEFLAAHDPDIAGCVILDLAMPGISGLDVQATLGASGCSRPIIFLSGCGSIATSVAAMRAGAVTFLTKPAHKRDLFAAVEEGLRIDAEARAREIMQREIEEHIASLTPREREVLVHVVAGRLNKQIAADLGTVVKTIKVHRARVMRKMGAKSLAHLVRLVTSVGLPTPPVDDDTGIDGELPPSLAHRNDRSNVIERPRSLFSRSAGGSLL